MPDRNFLASFRFEMDFTQEVTMSLAIVFGLCFFQVTGGMNSPSGLDRGVLARQVRQMADAQATGQAEKREAAYEERQFVDKFNHLLDVLQVFAKQYNEGHTLDLKKVKAVKKAWRELEKSDKWFRFEESPGH
jgi:hypothetical protein